MRTTSAELGEVTQRGWVLPADTVRTIVVALSRRAVPFALIGALSGLPSVGGTVVHEREGAFRPTDQGGTATFYSTVARSRPIGELGWTAEQGSALRHKLAAFAQDWDDPAMDAYDAL
jgi:hypothetical protein